MYLVTLTLSNHRQAAKLGIPLLDTTVKSGDKRLAPTWELLQAYKEGNMSKVNYRRHYRRIMRHSFDNNRKYWLSLFDKPTLGIACYCGVGKFCHRLLLKDIFEEIASNYNKDFHYLGELTKDTVDDVEGILSFFKEIPY